MTEEIENDFGMKCPQCGAPYLLEKSTKREGLVRYCNEEACKYKVAVEAEGVYLDDHGYR